MKQRLRQALSVFEDKTADEVADIVRRELDGSKAVCGNPQSCAIAVYLSRVLDLQYPWIPSVTVNAVTVFDVESENWEDVAAYYQNRVNLPAGIGQFISDFDMGMYPDLATEDSLAPLTEEVDA